MMNRLKFFYVSTYVGLVFFCVIYAIKSLLTNDTLYQSAGALIANFPTALLMSYFFLFQKAARTSANLYKGIVIALTGAALTLFGSTVETPNIPLLLMGIGVGLIGLFIYVFWHSRFDGRSSNALLKAGNQLPEFLVEDEKRNTINSKEFLGKTEW